MSDKAIIFTIEIDKTIREKKYQNGYIIIEIEKTIKKMNNELQNR